MMYEEFTNLIKTDAPTLEEYKVIETVYTFHPAFDVDSPKVKVAALYDLMGFGIFREMLPMANEAEDIQSEIHSRQADLNDAKRKLETFRDMYKSL